MYPVELPQAAASRVPHCCDKCLLDLRWEASGNMLCAPITERVCQHMYIMYITYVYLIVPSNKKTHKVSGFKSITTYH